MTDYDIKVFAMGGTIDKDIYSYDHSSYIVNEPRAPKILEAANVSARIVIESLVKKDSLDLDDQDRALLNGKIRGEPCPRIVVTHGTDTVTKSAQALDGISGKTIVFTGAMLPGRFVDSDAAFNMGGAIIAAQTLPPGLYLIMHGRVLDPLTVKKDRLKSLFLQDNKD
ncbi:MAG: asparaginase [Rhodospirillales bacterium]|nr:asparaginase [Alphaproteobacteria bacterium]MCB9987439.1 asparaginase [Rhodospirillales bacterium]USO07580.1 MAG: asparaginase [Rhodospirillales bacterium]